MLRRWGLTLAVAGSGAAAGVVLIATGARWPGVVMLVAFAALAVAVSPRVFPRSLPAADAQARSAADGRAIVYWRPGCPFCIRLRTTLGRDAGRAYWVDIWQDPAGAAVVRAVAGGNETVPTVFLGGESFVNPEPGWLKTRLRAG
jgi:mycoredoxin